MRLAVEIETSKKKAVVHRAAPEYNFHGMEVFLKIF